MLKNILMVAAENDAIPGAKVGGVADVVRDLPKALAEHDISVDVIIPDHNYYHQHLDSQLIAQIEVPFRGQTTAAYLYQVSLPEQPSQINQYIIWHESFSNQGDSGVYHHDIDNRPFATDANKFALFSVAVCEFLRANHIATPNVIHLHDWHAAFISVLLYFDERYQALKTIKRVFTVHNIALQGTRPFNQDESSLDAWFPYLAYQGQLICDPKFLHCFNPMRAGINLCDKVHVVSPTYSVEVQKKSNYQTGFYGGEGLELDLQQAHKENKLVGILNGCSYTNTDIMPTNETCQQFFEHAHQCLLAWSAQTTALKSVHFIASERIKQWQLTRKQDGAPLLTSVGRLTEQKVRLLLEPYRAGKLLNTLLKTLAEYQGKLILIGTGEPNIELAFSQIMANNENFLFLNGFDCALSESLYHLGDLFLMPSSFEPCGISQMLAMRAGQPCLVNQVGGLKDTVMHNESGFCFHGNTILEQLESLNQTFTEALQLRQQSPKQFQSIVDTAKQCRFDWQKSIKRYLSELY